MVARRLLFALIVILVVSSVAAALVPVDRDTDETTDRTDTRETRPQPPPGRVVERTVHVDRKRPATVEVASGDRLVLTVESGRFVEVALPAFGELAAAEPAAPAVFDLVPAEPGHYPVQILENGRRIATIAVARGGPSTND